MKITSTNPSRNYEEIGSVELSTAEDVQAKITQAYKAKSSWRELGIPGRTKLLQKVASEIEQSKVPLAKLIAQEMGMPITNALSEVDDALYYWNSYLETAEQYLKPETTLETEAELHQVVREPYGVVAAIAPWNFPISNFVWTCGQNLAAGNVIVFKHSEETPLCGKLIENIVNKVLPEGVFSEVYGDGSVGKMLVEQNVNFICFTGSTATGIKINESAARRFIPTSMELGGSAPGIILEDCNVAGIAETIYSNRFSNCGQMCDALKRLIVHESKLEQVKNELLKILATKKVGDAQDPKTDIGPLVAKRQLELLEEQVTDAVTKGANILTGGKSPDGLLGAYYEPTLIENVTPDMRIWQEEVFGPVLPIITSKAVDEAIDLANNTTYGLGAYVFTQDKQKFMDVARQLESGMVSQNNLSYVNSCNFFGGYKMSGGGREHAKFGFEEVTQTKVIASEK